mmetsp:Transcript_38106/g.99720  ORF Transcript_38106/g.99720 Transcript_38106/m.99720 type:complete len:217 (-) Transcript_38106:642-1292(-)
MRPAAPCYSGTKPLPMSDEVPCGILKMPPHHRQDLTSKVRTIAQRPPKHCPLLQSQLRPSPVARSHQPSPARFPETSPRGGGLWTALNHATPTLRRQPGRQSGRRADRHPTPDQPRPVLSRPDHAQQARGDCQQQCQASRQGSHRPRPPTANHHPPVRPHPNRARPAREPHCYRAHRTRGSRAPKCQRPSCPESLPRPGPSAAPGRPPTRPLLGTG